ncbi:MULTISPECIES: Rieske (2Fe-2S) protein [Pseudonocardia]|uniref:Cytochrome bc1 complex Rieske iron-sulfur subunit n=2 Tax=Pseudonocardia TaxID=1847 RepID=A0A1Y2N4R9_PSEAH|nr:MULTISPECIES: Rieske (2Fe-2S) protein [Pseudonocardia]OSY42077.1 Cytochrome b6-f complex iron-sulfur subunit [Pseudonocardia autotrophica]TDN75154.1 nitrite reductase/ring-hydroxylating ferredoxin subunit [Pseudonocardia autotrophica]BBF99099.1 iron-sulfur protein [Pseudonocardia autotrophica]GEC24019.1 iron-sulfur protein [Pseudonocardia saturnea]
MPPITRRRLFAGVGTAAAACCAAGCSTYGTPRAAGPAETGAGPAPAAADPAVPSAEPQAAEQGIAAASDIPVGGGRVFAEDGVVVTQPQAGTFAAFDATCPHAGCLVDQVTDTGISCPCHGSVFDIDGGAPLEGPAGAPLAARPVRVENDRIVLA